MSNEHKAGSECFLDSISPHTQFAAVFEDDGRTGYFYALDTARSGEQILNALHVYDVGKERSAGDALSVDISWSTSGQQAGLKINGTLAAVFDFSTTSGWSHGSQASAGEQWNNFTWDPKVEKWFS